MTQIHVYDSVPLLNVRLTYFIVDLGCLMGSSDIMGTKQSNRFCTHILPLFLSAPVCPQLRKWKHLILKMAQTISLKVNSDHSLPTRCRADISKSY